MPNFAAGGIATPSDASLVMQLGAESVFVGSGIFKSRSPESYAEAIVRTVVDFDNPSSVLSSSRGLGEAMPGLEMASLAEGEHLASGGW